MSISITFPSKTSHKTRKGRTHRVKKTCLESMIRGQRKLSSRIRKKK